MLRIVKLTISGAILLFIWLHVLSSCSDQFTRTLVLSFPFIVAILFGVSLLLSLVIGVLNFKTVPKEAELLQEDIARATRQLQSKGIYFDH